MLSLADIEVSSMAKLAGVQKDLMLKEANGTSSKPTGSAGQKVTDAKKRYDGIVVGSTKSSVQTVAIGSTNRSGFTFNSSNMGEETLEYDSSLDNASASSFDFHKDRAGNRPAIGPLSKPAPSKWDDAEKWLVSVSSIESAPSKSKSKSSSLQATHIVSSQNAQNPPKKPATLGQVRQSVMPGGNYVSQAVAMANGVVTNLPGAVDTSCISETIKSEGRDNLADSSSKSAVEWLKDVDTTKHITDHGEGAIKFSFAAGESEPPKIRPLPSPIDRYPLNDTLECGQQDSKDVRITSSRNDEKILQPTLRTQKPSTDFPTGNTLLPDLNKCEPLIPPPGASFLPPNLRSVSMRDMGTEMTPIASQEPSRTGTPNRATTPTLRSPICSRPSTPGRASPVPSPKQQGADAGGLCKESEAKLPELTEKELQAKTRQEILALGTQLGKANITAWATREEEEADAARRLQAIDLDELKKSVLETRAAAWEEAEKAKYTARYKREEARILAWENHEKAKAEAEMRRVEVKVEKMRSHSHERLMNKLASTRQRAEEMRVVAEARRGEQAAKTTQQANLIRRTGKMPSTFSCCSFFW